MRLRYAFLTFLGAGFLGATGGMYLSVLSTPPEYRRPISLTEILVGAGAALLVATIVMVVNRVGSRNG